MTRLMYDATHELAGNIPGNAQMVAGYLPPSGHAWTAADWARHPNAVQVRIAVRASTLDGHVLDVETGDATPAQAPGWVAARRAAGADPTVYCSAALWPAVIKAFAGAGVAQPHYWIAAYPGGGAGTIPAGAVAHQYQDAGIYDLSAVADYWPGVDGGGTVPVLDSTDLTNLGQAVLNAFIAFRVPGPDGAARNLWDSDYQDLATALGISKAEAAVLSAVQGADADVKAGITQLVAAVAAQPTGAQVDVAALAADLAADLPAQATPAQILAALAAQLAK